MLLHETLLYRGRAHRPARDPRRCGSSGRSPSPPSTVQLFTGSPSIQSTHHTAVRGVTAPVGSRQAEGVPDEVHQESRGSTVAVTSSPLTVIVTCIVSALLSCCPRGCPPECSVCQFAGQVALVVLRSALVGDRVATCGRQPSRPQRTTPRSLASLQGRLGLGRAEVFRRPRRRVRCRHE